MPVKPCRGCKVIPQLKGHAINREEWIKITCTNPECGYIARTSRKWIDRGLPMCYCGTQFTAESSDEDE